MKCKDIDALLDTHGIEQLNATGKAEIASHLESCRRCADAWLGHEMLAGETPAAPRAGFYAEALAAAVAGRTATAEEVVPTAAVAGASRRWRMVLGLAAGVVATAGLVWLALPDEAAEQGPATVVAEDSAESSAADFIGDTPSPGVLGDTPRLELRPGLPSIEISVPNFLAGTHYVRLPVAAPTTADAGQVEVCEFFTFGCVHCYNFEEVLEGWVTAQSEKVDFVRVPVLFNDVAALHAQAYYTAEALGAVDTIVGPFYAEIHERGRPLDTVADIRALFVRQGIDGARFDATFDSAQVRGDLRRAAELNRLYGVDSTPTIGVAGKYRTNVSMAGSNEALFDVVDALVEAESPAEALPEISPCSDADRCSTRQGMEPDESAAPGRGFPGRRF